jgi:hypothetical protein
LNREERRALKLIITDKVEQEVAKENKRRGKEKERLEAEQAALVQKLFNASVKAGRVTFDTPQIYWGNDGILDVDGKVKLTPSEQKKIKDSKRAIARVSDTIGHIKPVIDLVLAETVLGDKVDALKKVDGLVKEIVQRLMKKG